ncbi:hypothetical protein [Bifidobacterium callitrichidarum]|uniref:Uncharacterized protein n=1 Tax=Bifidobacterium callitrichidarum TaxID=2052941 RepID=A0A2U2N907_9BIFI|nr:hypothetical protein [Bifidobacterium callitrichidarum]PWG65651.1 hypothetical protein DF196_06880 [Bifidobacterium callitrichidarum]
MTITIPAFFQATSMNRGDKPGTMYMLTEKLPEAIVRKYLNSKNVVTGTASMRYAPEIKHDYMWVADSAHDVRFA